MKLILGLQFGLDYGISNSDGQTPVLEVKSSNYVLNTEYF